MRREAFAVRASGSYLSDASWNERVPAAISPAPERYLALVADNLEPVASDAADAIAFANRSLILLSEGQIEGAVNTATRAAELAPASAHVELTLGVTLTEAGRFSEALEAYDRAVALEPATTKIALFRGIALAGIERFNEAVAQYQQAISTNPSDVDALINLGVVRAKQAQFDAAIQACRRAVELDGDDPNLRLIYGFVLDQAGRFNDAVDAFREVIRQEPQRVAPYTICGSSLVKAGRLDEAIETLRHATELDPHDVVARFFLATAFDTAGQPARALEAYREALSIDNEKPEIHFLYGMALEAAGQLDQALNEFDTVVRLDPTHADAHLMRGRALQRLGRYADAVVAFNHVLTVEPGNTDALVNLALALLQLDRFDDAIGALDRAIVQNPNNLTIHLHQAYALLRAGRAPEALERLSAADSFRPGSAYLDFYRGSAYANTGRLDEAVEAYQKALNRWPPERRPLSANDRAAAQQNLIEFVRQRAQATNNVPSLYRDLQLIVQANKEVLSSNNVALTESSELIGLSITRRLLAEDPALRQYSEMVFDDRQLKAALVTLRSLDIGSDDSARVLAEVFRELVAGADKEAVDPTPLISTIDVGDYGAADAEAIADYIRTATGSPPLPVDMSVVTAALDVDLLSVALPGPPTVTSDLQQFEDGRLQIRITPDIPSSATRFCVAQHVSQLGEYYGRSKSPIGASIIAEDIRPADDPLVQRIARSLLMPQSTMKQWWAVFSNSQLMAAAFDVPVRAMRERIEELGLEQVSPDENRSDLTIEQEAWADFLARLARLAPTREHRRARLYARSRGP